MLLITRHLAEKQFLLEKQVMSFILKTWTLLDEKIDFWYNITVAQFLKRRKYFSTVFQFAHSGKTLHVFSLYILEIKFGTNSLASV